jgi:organic hydroperoxide reductase OsmC/OhrA
VEVLLVPRPRSGAVGASPATAEELARAAHQICPYSRRSRPPRLAREQEGR